MKITSEMAYPLRWPDGRPRTPYNKRQSARFRTPLGAACIDLADELKRLNGRYVVISSNIEGYKQAGMWRPYANRSQPHDAGVAVYFELDGDALCISCDRWLLVEDNIRAISKTIEAMRGIERWGSSEIMKRAFSGFKALPPSPGDDWRATLGYGYDFARSPTSVDHTLSIIKKRYRTLAGQAHPDLGGNPHEMSRLNQAFEAAKKELAQ